MKSPVEPMLRAMGPALDSLATPADTWSDLWSRVQAGRRRPTPVWPAFASAALCLTLFLSSTFVGIILGVTPTAAALAVPAPIVSLTSLTPQQTEAVGHRVNPAIDATEAAGTAAASTPAPQASPVR